MVEWLVAPIAASVRHVISPADFAGRLLQNPAVIDVYAVVNLWIRPQGCVAEIEYGRQRNVRRRILH